MSKVHVYFSWTVKFVYQANFTSQNWSGYNMKAEVRAQLPTKLGNTCTISVIVAQKWSFLKRNMFFYKDFVFCGVDWSCPIPWPKRFCNSTIKRYVGLLRTTKPYYYCDVYRAKKTINRCFRPVVLSYLLFTLEKNNSMQFR